MLLEEWREKQERKLVAQYTHFDRRISLETCWDYITSAEKVVQHGFFPFIHYTIKNRKVKNGKKGDPKERQIYYAAHKDGWIYRYYAYLLNEAYNVRIKQDGLNDVSVAYRTDLKKSNVDFAKTAFDFIKGIGECYVMIGDFTDFFDNLNHQYLKEQLCSLLSVDKLPPDYYAVFKNVTKFSYFELHDLLVLNGIKDTFSGRKEFNSPQRELALDMQEFRKSKEKYLKKNPKKFCGVPQGSPISAVLANIYMLSADKQINEYVTKNNGLYRRYSDDFIIILPMSQKEFRTQYNDIKAIIDQIPDLILKGEKTKLFYASEGLVRNCTEEFISEAVSNKHLIEFLGFSYDGESIRIRDKTISKYYNRMYRKVKTIVKQKGYTSKHKRISCKNLYDKYSYKGSKHYQKNLAYRKGIPFVEDDIQGNFFDYIVNAQNKFKGEPIDTPRKRHMQKIRKRLKKIEKGSL